MPVPAKLMFVWPQQRSARCLLISAAMAWRRAMRPPRPRCRASFRRCRHGLVSIREVQRVSKHARSAGLGELCRRRWRAPSYRSGSFRCVRIDSSQPSNTPFVPARRPRDNIRRSCKRIKRGDCKALLQLKNDASYDFTVQCRILPTSRRPVSEQTRPAQAFARCRNACPIK